MKQKLLLLLILLALAACIPTSSELAPLVVSPTLTLATQESATAVSTATAV